MKLKTLLLLTAISSSLFAQNFYYEGDKKIIIQEEIVSKTKSLNSSNSDIKTYKTTDGRVIKFKKEIIVQCKENLNCENDLLELGLNNFEKRSGYFLVTVDSNSGIFEIMQNLHNKDSILNAAPNYMISKAKR